MTGNALVGGLVGGNYGTIQDTYATGRVTGVGHVAGLAGSVWTNGVVRNSYSTGVVSSEKDWPFVGGLVGWLYGGSVSGSYWDTETSGQDEGASQVSRGGSINSNAGQTTARLQGIGPTGIYGGWDSATIWEFGASSEYPCLLDVTPGCEAHTDHARRGSVAVNAADPLAVNEGGAGAYTVVLDGEPAGNVVITVSSDNADVSAQPSSLTFTPNNWQTPQTVTVRASQDDDAADDAATLDHQVSGAHGYAGIVVAPVSVAVSDDDTAGVTLSEPSLSLNEGDSATYTVVLDTPPVADVVIYPSGQGVTVQPVSLTFTSANWHTPQMVTVTAPHDADTADGAAAVTHSIVAFAGSAYANVSAGVVLVSITDDDEFNTQQAQHNDAADAEDPEPADEPEPEPAAPTDREALVAFYESTGGASWTNNANWLSDRPLREWHGVSVNAQGQVTHLSLRNNNLSGALPAALGQLDALRVLSLDRNSLSGSLPTELGNLSNLTRLALNRNQLSGSIPSQLGNLSNLSIIGLARNSLSGALPSSLGNLSLTRLSLHDNTALSGALPAGFAGMNSLQRLVIANTGMCIPSGQDFDDWVAGIPDVPGRDGLARCG